MTGNPTNSYCIKGEDEKLIFLIYSHGVFCKWCLAPCQNSKSTKSLKEARHTRSKKKQTVTKCIDDDEADARLLADQGFCTHFVIISPLKLLY